MKLLLLGGTDITLGIGQAAHRAGIETAVVAVPPEISISFNQGPMHVARHADVEAWARAHQVDVQRFSNLGDLERFADEVGADVAVAAGWYHMLPASFRRRFPAGCLGVHASLLPALRGHAPLNWAILAGLEETGVSLFQLGDGIDDGPVFAQLRLPLSPRVRIGELVEEARSAAVSLVLESLHGIVNGSLRPSPQSGAASYCLSRIPEDGRVEWSKAAAEIDRLVRAVSQPYPGAFSFLEGERVSIWAAEVVAGAPRVYGVAGQLVRLPEVANPCVVCGEGILCVVEATTASGEDALPLLRKRTYRRLAPGG